MRHAPMLFAMLIPLSAGTGLALAQSPVAQVTEPAPVPNVMPGVPGGAGPGTMPDQVAPPAVAAGPADATPFSAAPSAMMPSDQTMPAARDNGSNATGSAGTVPNMSK